MKKIILFYFLCITFISGAQILNPGFENVTSGKPNNWNLTSYSTYYIHDTSDAHSGSHAAYIKAFGAQSYSVQGAVLGFFGITPSEPLALTGWYKCGLQALDSLVFSPYVYETTIASPALQSYAFTTTSTAVYKQFSAAFSYSAFTGPSVDTLFVSIYLSGPTKDNDSVFVPQAGTWAIIDDISLSYPVATAIKTLEGSVSMVEKVYPQPAADYAYFIYSLTESTVCNLQVFDITGKAVKTVLSNEKQTPGRYKAELDLEGLNAGVYFVKLKAGDETHVSKLVKQ